MKKIKILETMTAEQEAKVPEYIKKWLDIGRKTKTLDEAQTTKAIKSIYSIGKLEEPKYFFFFDSPLQCQLAVGIIKSLMKENNLWDNLGRNLGDNLGNNLWDNLGRNLGNNLGDNLGNNLGINLWNNLGINLWNNLRNNLGDNIRNNLGNNLENNLMNNLWNNLWSNLGDNLGNNLENNLRNNLMNNLRNNLGNNIRNNLWSNLWSNLGDNLGDNLWNNLGDNLRNNLWNKLGNKLENNLEFKYEYGFFENYYSYWVGYYDFVLNELFTGHVREFEELNVLSKALKDVHFFIPFKDVVFISQTPVNITLDNRGRLHNEDAPALMYADGYSLFYLNGIQVPKWAIETKRADIKPVDVLALENTEQRMVLMRYVGLSNFMKELNAKEIDSYKDYKLYYITVEGQEVGPYLRMVCPSTGREFLEGVGDAEGNNFIDSTIKTCQDALKWRATRASKNLMTKFNLNWKYHA
jgi:hypothetical protein